MGDQSEEPQPPIKPGDDASKDEQREYTRDFNAWRKVMAEKTAVVGYMYPNEGDASRLLSYIRHIEDMGMLTEQKYAEATEYAIESMMRGHKPNYDIMRMFLTSGLPDPSSASSDAQYTTLLCNALGPQNQDLVMMEVEEGQLSPTQLNRLAVQRRYKLVPLAINNSNHLCVRIADGNGLLLVDAMIRFYAEAYGRLGVKGDYMRKCANVELVVGERNNLLEARLVKRDAITGAVSDIIKKVVAIYPMSVSKSLAVSEVRSYYPDVGAMSDTKDAQLNAKLFDDAFAQFSKTLGNMDYDDLVRMRYKVVVTSSWEALNPQVQLNESHYKTYLSTTKRWNSIIPKQFQGELLGKGRDSTNLMVIEVDGQYRAEFNIDELDDVKLIAAEFRRRYPTVKEAIVEDSGAKATPVTLTMVGGKRTSTVRIPIDAKGEAGKHYTYTVAGTSRIDTNIVTIPVEDNLAIRYEEQTSGLPEIAMMTGLIVGMMLTGHYLSNNHAWR